MINIINHILPLIYFLTNSLFYHFLQKIQNKIKRNKKRERNISFSLVMSLANPYSPRPLP
ncbi:hypothetical protein HMPREF9093_00951, partial [Fusobacterium sp. oral taxon 370 str. F0437]